MIMSRWEDKQQARREVRRTTLSATDAAAIMSGRPTDTQISSIVRLLHSDDHVIRVGALKSLIALAGKEAQAAVLSSMTDEAPQVRAAAYKGIGQLRMYDLKDKALEALGDPDEMVRCCAAAALGLLGDKKKALNIILKYTRPSHALRWEALRCLNLIIGKRFPANMYGLKDAVSWVRANKREIIKS